MSTPYDQLRPEAYEPPVHWAPPAPPAKRRRRRWPLVAQLLWLGVFVLWMVALANVDPEVTGNQLNDAAAQAGNDLGQALWGTVAVFVWLFGVVILLLAQLATRRRGDR